MVIKAKKWPEEDLRGLWEVSYKLDGVRTIVENGQVLSRAGKVLHGLQQAAEHLEGDFEFFLKDFKTTISITRTHQQRCWEELKDGFYSLAPVDARLFVGEFENPSKGFIEDLFKKAVAEGYEGLVLKQGSVWYKIKEDYTADVLIIGVQEGTGRNKGRLGALLTTRGKVGTGLTDADRKELWKTQVIGQLVEVSYMELTPSGKFRHPRFVRIRDDKLEETI